jgi:hypothetical protein
LFGTGAALMFKGSGFYQTDYRSDSYKKAAQADSSNGSGKSSDAKSDGGAKASDASCSGDKSSCKKCAD